MGVRGIEFGWGKKSVIEGGPRFLTLIEMEISMRNLCQLYPEELTVLTPMIFQMFAELKDPDSKRLIYNKNDTGCPGSLLEKYVIA